MAKTRDTKRPVDLVSSHDDDENNDGPSLICDDEPEGLSVPHSSTGLGTHTLPFKLRPGENLLYYEEYIPDIDRNEY
jgi:hypothetical protein